VAKEHFSFYRRHLNPRLIWDASLKGEPVHAACARQPKISAHLSGDPISRERQHRALRNYDMLEFLGPDGYFPNSTVFGSSSISAWWMTRSARSRRGG
jgi:hypothetical protein